METNVEVLIWGQKVGIASWDATKNVGAFTYDNGWLKKGIDLSPIWMPIDGQKFTYSFPTLGKATFRGLPGMLADSLPDHFGDKVIKAWLTKIGKPKTALSPIEQLCFVGNRGMGALEYRPQLASPSKIEEQRIEIDHLVSLANEVVSNRVSNQMDLFGSPVYDLKHLMKVGSSAGGARPKAVVAYAPKTGHLSASHACNDLGFEDWMIKFDGIGKLATSNMGRIEYAYYLMARNAGIDMMKSTLLEENGRAHFMTKRFDRLHGEKVHSQTLCALIHADYRKSDVFGYEHVFRLMRKLQMPHAEIVAFYRRMLFNVFGRNQDDHTKNISFLMTKEGNWQLSPAYDITFGYNPKGRWTRQHRMSINGKRDHFSKNDLFEIGKKQGIENCSQVFDEVQESVSSWTRFAAMAGLRPEQSNTIYQNLRLNWN